LLPGSHTTCENVAAAKIVDLTAFNRAR
jgi:hypothetical protein